MLLLFLPFNPSQARREFGSMCFVMCYALATHSVSRASFLRAWALNIVMWAGHSGFG